MLRVLLLAASALDVDSPAFHARLEQAVIRGSLPALEQCRDALVASAAERPTPARSYTLAYADWRLVSLLPDDRAGERETVLREAEKALGSAIALEPANAEAHGLLASVLGRRIGFNPALGATLGPRAGEHLALAQRHDGNGRSPRLPLLRGIRAFVVPAEYGGSVERAEAELRRADELFGQEPADKAWPNWGRLDTLAWLGQALARKGDRDGARRAYQRAIEMAPDYGFVARLLLPALDGKKGGHTH